MPKSSMKHSFGLQQNWEQSICHPPHTVVPFTIGQASLIISWQTWLSFLLDKIHKLYLFFFLRRSKILRLLVILSLLSQCCWLYCSTLLLLKNKMTWFLKVCKLSYLQSYVFTGTLTTAFISVLQPCTLPKSRHNNHGYLHPSISYTACFPHS